MRTGEAAIVSRRMSVPSRRTWPNWSVPVGQTSTQAEQRTHSGSTIGRPRLAKLITSMPWWHEAVQALHEMHRAFSGTMAKRLNRA